MINHYKQQFYQNGEPITTAQAITAFRACEEMTLTTATEIFRLIEKEYRKRKE